MDQVQQNVNPFNRDAMHHDGYLDTLGDRLSSRLATQRLKDILLETGCFTGRSVLDIGCGDGHHTIYFWDHGGPKQIVGVDAAANAVAVATAKKQDRPIQFVAGDMHRIPYADNSFDVALLQGVLHHDDDPLAALREAFRIAPTVLILEPNGNNMGLKIIERTSRYHREHRERSYSSRRLTRWIAQVGGRVVYKRYAGLVPMFCPDWLARTVKAVEPVVEGLPVVRDLGCAVIVLVARREAQA